MDPRAESEERLVAPGHLPYVSRSSLKRVTDNLPPITQCPCGGTVSIKHHNYIYGMAYSDWPWVYFCEDCRAYVGMHPHTDLPLGTLANAVVRKARKRERVAFTELQDWLGVNQNEMREWLAGQMQMPVEQCHWAMFDEATAVKAGKICRRTMKHFKKAKRS